MVESIDQAAGKRVAAAHAVDDVADLVFFRYAEILAVIQTRRPAVPVGRVALAQRDGDASFALSSTTTGTTPAADRRLISHIIYVTLYRGKIMLAQHRAVPSSCAWTYVRCTDAHTDPTRPARSCSGVQSSCE